MVKAEELKELSDEIDITIVFKSSLNKANHTSLKRAQGMELDQSLAVVS